MLLPNLHAWTQRQRWFIAVAVALAVASVIMLICVYERHYRGPDDSVLVGTWEDRDIDERIVFYYQLKPDHTFAIFASDGNSEPISRGKWYAGGRQVYLRFHVEEPWDRELEIWHIDDISPDQIRIRIARQGFTHTYKRVDLPKASNQALQPTADRQENYKGEIRK
jgi:hypothetical protein